MVDPNADVCPRLWLEAQQARRCVHVSWRNHRSPDGTAPAVANYADETIRTLMAKVRAHFKGEEKVGTLPEGVRDLWRGVVAAHLVHMHGTRLRHIPANHDRILDMVCVVTNAAQDMMSCRGHHTARLNYWMRYNLDVLCSLSG